MASLDEGKFRRGKEKEANELSISISERIVMTPKKKTANSTTLMMERKIVSTDSNTKMHFAGGSNKGIVVNKEKSIDEGGNAFLVLPNVCIYFQFYPYFR